MKTLYEFGWILITTEDGQELIWVED